MLYEVITDLQLTAVRDIQQVHQAEQGALAGPAGAQQHQGLPGLAAKADLAEDGLLEPRLGDPFQLYAHLPFFTPLALFAPILVTT